MKTLALVLAALSALIVTTFARDAHACGCFTPPDPSVPVVQAGERILFARDSGNVTAHIQIQYAGDAAEFGWILPLPSVPTLELGTDELFNQLTTQTQPKYRLTRVFEGDCFSRGGINLGSSADSAGSEGGPPQVPGNSGPIVVVQDSIGPYDYAVLRAHSRVEMLDWLERNRYFVPAGTDDVVSPYIHDGAYFLALKLRSGKSVGDLQPVVVKYASDLPMIPIVLTSVAAQPDMGIQVWMLGEGRAIPRNYFHTVINDAKIDWFTAGANYNDVIIEATREAEGRHTFVTEYAGSSQLMRQLLDAPGRFGSKSELATQTNVFNFVNYLESHGFLTTLNGGSGPFGPIVTQSYSSQLTAILGLYIPVPPALAERGVTPSQFYGQLDYYLGTYRGQYPEQFIGYEYDYRPADMADDLWERVVTPTVEAGALFSKYPYLTRLYTTLSPEQMNRDPVFSQNTRLADVNNVHEATLTIHCGLFGGEDIGKLPATLKTEQGYEFEYSNGVGTNASPFNPQPLPIDVVMPASSRIEIVGEEGAARVVVDNREAIGDALDGGCQAAPASRTTRGGELLGLLMLALYGMRHALRTRQR
jgi:hypothetical protein